MHEMSLCLFLGYLHLLRETHSSRERIKGQTLKHCVQHSTSFFHGICDSLALYIKHQKWLVSQTSMSVFSIYLADDETTVEKIQTAEDLPHDAHLLFRCCLKAVSDSECPARCLLDWIMLASCCDGHQLNYLRNNAEVGITKRPPEISLILLMNHSYLHSVLKGLPWERGFRDV